MKTFDAKSIFCGQNGFDLTELKYIFLFFKYWKKKTYFGNKYIPSFCPYDLPWYERDGLLTWYDQNKYSEFSKNPEEYLRNKRVIDFHMINAQCRGDKREYSHKHYQTFIDPIF